MESLKYLSEFDPVLSEHMQSGSAFTGLSSTIQNDLISAVHTVLDSYLRERIKHSPFVSVIVDEATDVANKAQLAVVLRITNMEDCISEHFVEVIDVSENRRADGIATSVLSVLEKYEVSPGKLVAQTYDGAAVMSADVNGVQARIRETHESAF